MESDTDSDSSFENENYLIQNLSKESGYNSNNSASSHPSNEETDENVLTTNHGGLGHAFANAKPIPTNKKKFGSQIFMFFLFVSFFAFMIFPCAIWIQSFEEKYEISQTYKIRKSSDELKKYRSIFTNKLCDIIMFVNDNDNDNNDDENDGSNATITTSDKIDQNVKEFLEIYYFQRYKKFDKDLQAFDFEQGKSDKSWNLGKIIESLLSVMMLTGSDKIFYKTLFGRVLMFTIAAVGSFLVTIVLASCSSLTILGIKKCFEMFSICKSSRDKFYDKNYFATDITIDFGILIVVTVCCGGSILLGGMAMKNDQPSWSISDATLYTFAQATTLGNSQFLPDRTALSQQTFYSIYFYASIRIFTMYWITCFTLALFNLSENLDKIARSGLSSLDMEDILIVDRARMRRQKFVKYMK